MKSLKLSAITILLLASCSNVGDNQVRIDCGATDVILTEEQATLVRDNTVLSPAEFAGRVCEIFGNVDASQYTEPTNVRVAMPSGVELSAQMQVSQN